MWESSFQCRHDLCGLGEIKKCERVSLDAYVVQAGTLKEMKKLASLKRLSIHARNGIDAGLFKLIMKACPKLESI
jgi:hypothetical protein